MKLTTYEMVLCAFCAAVTCVLAPISVPLAGEVPISLATFAVLLSGILLGAKFGAISQLVYVLLGSVGVPVFAGWTGGIGITLGVTGGYIIGYILMAFVAGLLYHRRLCSFQWSLQPPRSIFWAQHGSWPRPE